MTDRPTEPEASHADGEAIAKTIEPALEGLPPEKQREITESIERTFMAVVRGSTGPQVDPETARVVAATVEKDNDNKFRYLSQRQSDLAAQQARDHELATSRHRDLMRPIVWAVIAIALVAVFGGMLFIWNGQEAIGSSILTGVFGALLGYLGGLGTAPHLRRS